MNIPRNRTFWAVSLGHMTNDLYMSMGPVLLAFLSGQVLPITNAQIGAAVSAQALIGAVGQPLFGWVGDRGGPHWKRVLGVGGVLWTASFLLLSLALAMTGRFWLMVVPYAIAALGSGAFHPIGTAVAGEANKGAAASSLSFFFFLGQLGLALGPALTGILLDWANPPGAAAVSVTPIYFLGLFTLPVLGFMMIAMPGIRAYQQRSTSNKEETPSAAIEETVSTGGAFANVSVKALLLLAAVVTLRSLAQPGAVPFIPRMFEQKGWDPTTYGLITSSFWLASGFFGIAFGQLADRFNTRYVIAASLLLSVPAIFLLPTASVPAAGFLLAIAVGGLTGGSHSIIVAMAQSMIPSSKGFVSGLTLGFIFGTGAISSFLIGAVADQVGLAVTFQFVAGATFIAGLLAWFLPDEQSQEATQPQRVQPTTSTAR